MSAVLIGRFMGWVADRLPGVGDDVLEAADELEDETEAGWLGGLGWFAPAEPSWRGWAVPAILEVLAENNCGTAEWREHVAPLIADRIGCDPVRAIEALTHHQPDKVTP